MPVAPRLPPLPTTRDVLRMFGIQAKKKLSQNFLLDPRTLDRFARTAGDLKGKTVVEIGPGPGGITRAILGQGAREVHVIEKDTRFLPSLKLLQDASGGVLHINMGDCLRYNMSKLFPDELRRPWHDPVLPDIHLLGNLPFGVATPFIIKTLHSMHEHVNLFSYGRVPLLLTFQYEVAHRMVAPPGDRERSRISVMCQNYTQVRLEYVLPGGAFVPPPKVDAAVVSFLPLRTPYINLPFKFVERVVTSIFHGKKKNLSNTAKNLFPRDYEFLRNVDHLLNVADIDRKRLPFTLTMDELERICLTYKLMCDRDPKIKNFISPEIQPLLLENQTFEHLKFRDESEDEIPQVVFREENKDNFFPF